jgi:multidrug efflux system membrane fusion protein
VFRNRSKSELFSLVICPVVGVFLLSCAKQEQPGAMAMAMPSVPVRAVAATASDVPLQVSAVGNVEAGAAVDVKSLVAGEVLRVDFGEGQNVAKGQLLFEIDPEPLNRQLAQTQADITKDRRSRAGAGQRGHLLERADRAGRGHERFRFGRARCG